MPEAAAKKTKLDKLYLRFFKYAVVGLMTLALLSIVVLLPMAAYSYFQAPLPPVPAKAPPDRAVDLEEFKAFLIEQEKRRLEQEKRGTAPVAREPVNAPALSQLYAEQVLALYRCTEEFAKLAEQPLDNSSEAETAYRREQQRVYIEQLAKHQFRGPNWPNALVTFACSVLKNPEIAKLKKDQLIGPVVTPVINFHAQTWASIEEQKSSFRMNEERRVQQEILAEGVRVAAAKARAVFILSLIGGALLFFMIMALYLIFAKIEDNLALIHQAILQRPEPEAATV